MSGQAHVPPGWPKEVRPPEAPDWESTAVAWLFDLCPPDYRGYDVLRRHPIVLARFAARHVAAARDAAAAGMGNVRAELRDLASTEVIEAAVGTFERESQRLAAAARAVELVEQALQGKRYVPRL